MIAKLELDNHVMSTFDVDNVNEAISRSIEICRDFDSGGVLMIDGKDYGSFDIGKDFIYKNLTTGETCCIV